MASDRTRGPSAEPGAAERDPEPAERDPEPAERAERDPELAAHRALVEKLRQSGLRLDREGRWWHRGEPVAHRGLAAALHRWLDRLEDGRYVVRLDAERYAYVEVEDAPYQVLTVEIERSPEGPRVHLRLSDGTEEELDYRALRVGAENALYCQVKGRFTARFSRPAYYLLGELLEEGPAGFVLRAAGELWPIEDLPR